MASRTSGCRRKNLRSVSIGQVRKIMRRTRRARADSAETSSVPSGAGSKGSVRFRAKSGRSIGRRSRGASSDAGSSEASRAHRKQRPRIPSAPRLFPDSLKPGLPGRFGDFRDGKSPRDDLFRHLPQKNQTQHLTEKHRGELHARIAVHVQGVKDGDPEIIARITESNPGYRKGWLPLGWNPCPVSNEIAGFRSPPKSPKTRGESGSENRFHAASNKMAIHAA